MSTQPQCVYGFMLALLASLLLVFAVDVQAADLRWNGRPFQMVAADKPLADFLRELAASQGTTAVVDPKVSGSISGKFSGGALNILTSVASTNGLTWYYDGAFLYIEPSADARSEVLPIASGNAKRISEILARLNIADRRYPITVFDREGQASVHVAGPRRYVEMVRQTVKLIDQNTARVDHAEVRLFPLRYAWAGDVKIARAGRETTIPGVASVLRSLFAGGGARGAVSSGHATGMPMRTTDRKLRLRSGETVNAPKIDMPGVQPADDSNGAIPVSSSSELPQFHVDARANAVIVRDNPDRMGQYAKLIESMDVRPRLVEIEVTIMDISSDRLTSLGVDWRAHSGRADLQFGSGDRPPLTFGGHNEAGQTGATTPLGALFSVAIGHDARRYLLARVAALAQKGNAQLVARPKILTLDNNEAVLENLSEFFVRVSGFQDAGLFSVSTGTAVRVTPLIVDDKSARGVMLSIHIDDGDLGGGSVDQIPIVRRRLVNTQALVSEGQSLLIAGFTSEEQRNVSSGVPVLSEIPVLGQLFKFSEKKNLNMERFYLLTPRLFAPPTAGAPTPPTSPVDPVAPATPAPVPWATPRGDGPVEERTPR
jgi:type III secretion protein C